MMIFAHLGLLLALLHLPVDVKTVRNSFGTIEENIEYAGAASASSNALDLFLPDTTDFPVVLFIHGGSFVAGSRKDFPYAQIGENFQRHGVGCAVMSYRLAHDSVWPAQPRDVAKAFAWLKENIAQLGGNARRIFIVGHSAGGHLAALVSTDAEYLQENGDDLKDIAGTVAMGTMMSDAGSLSGISEAQADELFRTDWFLKLFGNRKNFENSLPVRHVNTNEPPMLLMLADEERFDPPKEETVREFMHKASDAGARVEYQVLAQRSHMGTVERMTEKDDPAMKLVLEFIRKQKN